MVPPSGLSSFYPPPDRLSFGGQLAVIFVVVTFLLAGFALGILFEKTTYAPSPRYKEYLPWNVDLTDAEVLWGGYSGATEVINPKMAGAGVNVALFDTGVDASHRDVRGSYAGGLNFAHGLSDDDVDTFGHGTAAASVLAAPSDGAGGIIGVAPLARIWSVKVLSDQGRGQWSWVIEATDWAINTRHDSDPTNDIDIISMSFGGYFISPAAKQMLYKAYMEGIVLVAAAGNVEQIGDSVRSYPAALDFVISVGSVDSNLRLSYFSNNQDVDFVMPGENIRAACTGYFQDIYYDYLLDRLEYCWISGTSMSAPHLSGVIAILMSSGANRTPMNIYARLTSGSYDLGEKGFDNSFGWGFVHVPRLFDLPEGTPVPYTVSSPPASLLLNTDFDKGTTIIVLRQNE